MSSEVQNQYKNTGVISNQSKCVNMLELFYVFIKNKERNIVMKRYCILIVIITLISITGRAWAAEGMKQLMDMATKIAETKKFSISILMGYDAVQTSGQKIEFSERRKILVSRANFLRVDTQLSNGDIKGMFETFRKRSIMNKYMNSSILFLNPVPEYFYLTSFNIL